MAKGLEKHKERLAALNLFGKDLTRRCGAKCELCSESGVALRVFEAQPAPVVPEAEFCVFICDTCRDQLERPKSLDVDRWRCAAESIWSEVPAVQVLSARVLDRVGKSEMWAREAREGMDLDAEVEEWIAKEQL